MAAPRPREAHHFGPDVRHVGGMASVLRVLAEGSVGAQRVVLHPTWVPDDRRRTLGQLLRALGAVCRLPADAVVHVHLAEGGSFVREGAVLAAAHARSLRTAATLHGADFVAFAAAHPRLVAGVLGRADVVTALSTEARDLAATLAPRARAVLLPNPVVERTDLRRADEAPEHVLFAGEVSLRKGADVLAAAWPLVTAARPGATCTLVGPPTDLVVDDAPGLRVLPAVGPAELRALLDEARVVALPSRAEAMPMTLLEAMGAGRPFVATPVGGVPALADDGGTLVPVGDAPALAEALLAFLRDPLAARTVGESGRRACAASRGLAVVDAELARLYAPDAA